MYGNFICVPNLITTVRVIISPIVIFCFLYSCYNVAYVLLCVGLLSDFFDGFASRMLHSQSVFGTWYDIIADKIFFNSVVIVGFFIDIIPLYFCIFIFIRDLLQMISIGYLFLTSHIFLYRYRPLLLNKFVSVLTYLVFLKIFFEYQGIIPVGYLETTVDINWLYYGVIALSCVTIVRLILGWKFADKYKLF